MKRPVIVSLYLLLFYLLTCATPDTIAKRTPSPYWDDLARFLAGMPLRAESSLATLTGTDSYRRHVSVMNRFWGMVLSENTNHIASWRAAHLTRRYAKNIAFYPFSGADFVNLYTLFPDSRYYIMIALEEPGSVPDPMKLSSWQLQAGLSSVQRGIWTIASENYFKSGIMQRELNNKYLEGVTPILLLFAARLGCTVTDVVPVCLDESGSIKALERDGRLKTKTPSTTGIYIDFKAPGERGRRTLVYLRHRLSAGSLDARTAEGKFFNRLRHLNTVIKSAVYLLHRESLKGFCDFILDRSDLVIQDDSGIPYRYFDKRRWEITRFGIYVYPRSLKDLPNPPYQPDLALDYARKSLPLSFNFGYGVLTGRGRSNMVHAVKNGK